MTLWSNATSRLKRLLRSWFYALRGITYLGKTLYCPCCGWHLRSFIPAYGGLCPRCASVPRHRSAWTWLCGQRLLEHHARLLHFAPEFWAERKFKAMKSIDYVTADLSSPWADLEVDIQCMKVESRSFDAVWCSHVLEHVPDDRAAMKEICRILKPGGWALIMVPVDWNRPLTWEDETIIDPQRRAECFGHPEHLRLYGRDFLDRLEAAGFGVDLHDFQPPPNDRSGLSHEKIFLCRRP